MRSAFISAAALFACVQAIRITSPTKDDTIDPSKGVTVKWSTVSTDPKTAHLVLVNQAGGHTPYSKDLGEVDLTKGSVTVTVANVPNDSAYQFNIESVTELNTGILAQSAQFDVEAGASSSSATTSSSSSSSAVVASSTASTLQSVVTPPPTVTAGGGGNSTQTAKTSSTSTASTAGAVAAQVQSGSLLAFAVGLAAFMA
ncbi:Ser-Thr-rich glycosyl-phosphatidyl-inositol-anchored membrane family-domain-containing protein [Lasiosphaeria ovina]|uniref:Ser-Thr-rich glycosyl-phosphatidyl-inositol-anchored membrane family-domain-containing protein n=1 Tax=Lasiosphaeria ovina TaxID=92902 RepID=A0AAE0JS66_9PEZI|nr:Ser-Thr-rich glycosyl-phosphatidyl-inositol-anchored membrane family-domain-containing protein [Lasiosphaeria ovina]